MTNKKPVLYITLGLPASGKTYFTQKLAADLGIFFLNTDALRMAMIKEPTFTPAEHKTVYRTMHHLAEQHLSQGLSIVCNGNYNQRIHRQAMYDMARSHGAEVYTILVEAPLEVITQRIQTRDHEIAPDKMVHQPLELLERMQKLLEAPKPDEPLITIDGTASYEAQYEAFQLQLKTHQH